MSTEDLKSDTDENIMAALDVWAKSKGLPGVTGFSRSRSYYAVIATVGDDDVEHVVRYRDLDIVGGSDD